MILFFVVFLLGVVTSGAIVVGQAIIQTEVNLLRQIPPVATIIQDAEAIEEYELLHGEFEGFEWLSAEVIEAVGYLSYVRAFNYSVIAHNFFSRELRLPREAQVYSIDGLDESISFEFELFSRYTQGVEGIEVMRLKGVSYPAIVDIEEGVLELVHGRAFTTEEMEGNLEVALISQAFAEVNHLQVGETFYIDHIIFDEGTLEEVANESIGLEIVGIFTPAVELDLDSELIDIINHINFSSLIYVPITIAKSSTYAFLDHFKEFDVEQFNIVRERGFMYEDIIFVLYDSLDLNSFVAAASELIPDFWRMNDLSDSFSEMTTSMSTLQGLSSGIMIGGAMASIFALSLLIVLFLHDRREEVGIYLALGEKKSYIVLQVFVEVLTVAVVAIALSLIIGSTLAEYLSQEMIRNDLIANSSADRFIRMGSFNDFNAMGYGFEMTIEEMLEAYSVSLDIMTILLFFLVSITTTLLSTSVSMIYLARLNPKDILMKSTIG